MKLVLSINGMTCGGCEMHVEKAVQSIQSIISAKANHSEGKLIVETDDSVKEINRDALLIEIASRVKDAGYEFCGMYKKKNGENFSLKQWVGILIVLAALFLAVRESGIMNRLPVLESSMGYGLIFIIGLMTSVHCIGMCGGINLTVSLAGIKNFQGESSVFKRSMPAFLYNLGRVVSYTAVGALVGALGSVISITGNVQGLIVGVAGLFMLLMGINMLGLFPWVGKILPRLPKGLSSRIVNSGNGRGPFIVGLLNGFMPCGPLQSVQIYALGTGSAFSGALSMFLFSLGTVPLMLGFGSISSILPRKFHGRILKVSALLVLMLGGGMILRGMSLNGVSLMGANSFNQSSENVRIAEISNGKQYVTTIMHGDEYEPFIVQAGIPVVWTIEAAEEDLNGCNNPLTVPEYDIRFEMKPGLNTIEFTPPKEESTIIYTCWMGMITSGIKVVSDLSAVDSSLLSDTAALSGESDGSCSSGCCSSEGAGSDFSSIDPGGFLGFTAPKIDNEVVGIARLEEGIHIVDLKITENGFEPSVIVMQKGTETNWLINGESLNDLNYRISFPSFGNQGIELKEGINTLQFVPEADFVYFSWKMDFGGYVKVVDDISNFDLSSVKTDVQEYNIQNNY